MSKLLSSLLCYNIIIILHSVSSVESLLNTMGQAVSTTQFFVYGKRHFTKYVDYVAFDLLRSVLTLDLWLAGWLFLPCHM